MRNTLWVCCLLQIAPLFSAGLVTRRSAEASRWAGVNSFYLHALSDGDQEEIIQNLNAANVMVVRIFLSSVGAGSKGSSADEVWDIEHVEVGAYNDTILERVDLLMTKLHSYDMKIIITLHDRYSLGCWAVDAYVEKYDLPVTADCGTDANEPDNFYANSSAMEDFDNRIRHILSHQNPHFDNRSWASLAEVIYAFDIENESQAYMETKNQAWLCDRAEAIRDALGDASDILIGTGGGGGFEDSLNVTKFRCPFIDVISVHSYADIESYASYFQKGLKLADEFEKMVIFEEFGHTEGKGQFFNDVFAMTNFYAIPTMPWEVMKPGNPSDFEFYVDDSSAWEALTRRAGEAEGSLYSTGAWCSQNSDCLSVCCSNTMSSDPSSFSYGRLICVDNVDSNKDLCNAPSDDGALPDNSFCAKSEQCASACCGLDGARAAMACAPAATGGREGACLYP